MIDLPLHRHHINDDNDYNVGDNDDVVKITLRMMYNVHTTSMRIIPATVAAPAAIWMDLPRVGGVGIPFCGNSLLWTLTSATDDTGDMVMILRRVRMVVHMTQIIQMKCCYTWYRWYGDDIEECENMIHIRWHVDVDLENDLCELIESMLSIVNSPGSLNQQILLPKNLVGLV